MSTLEIDTIVQPVSLPSGEKKKQRAKAAKALYNARQRCTNPKNKDYANYGALGIQVLLTVDELIAAIGLPSPKASLDRIDPHGHYEVGNVRWATKAVQAANKKASLVVSTPPVQMLVAQQKLVMEKKNQRIGVAEAWQLLLKAFNSGKLSEAEKARLVELLNLGASPHATFGSKEKIVGGKTLSIFRLPSLTLPGWAVEARGPLKPAPDADTVRQYMRHGILFGLRDIESLSNLPVPVRDAINHLWGMDHHRGLTLVGRPSKADLASGWFEIWMLAAASRFSFMGVRSAFFPAITCLETLAELGNPSAWDEVSHPLLDAALLFIPDFSLI